MKTFSFLFDFYIVYFLYSSKKLHRYHRYMISKWGDRYSNKIK